MLRQWLCYKDGTRRNPCIYELFRAYDIRRNCLDSPRKARQKVHPGGRRRATGNSRHKNGPIRIDKCICDVRTFTDRNFRSADVLIFMSKIQKGEEKRKKKKDHSDRSDRDADYCEDDDGCDLPEEEDSDENEGG